MKSMLLILPLYFLGQGLHAATHIYDIKFALKVNNQPSTESRVLASEGETATVTHTSGKTRRFIDVVAKEGSLGGHNGILLNFTIAEQGLDGQKKIISRPQILASNNQQAMIQVSGNNAKSHRSSKMELKVVAQRH